MEQIKVDIIPGRAIPVCHSSQFDVGRVIRVNITDGYSSNYVLDGTEEVTVNVRKVDGNLVVLQCDVVTGRSYIDVVTTEQMTACSGSNLADLTIKKHGTTIGTMNFILEVEKDPTVDGVVSASEIYNLEMQIREINEQILPSQVAEQLATMYDSSDVLFDDAPTENHGVPYTVTSEGIKAKFDGLDLSENSLNNVDLDPEPADGDALVYNATTNKWINAEAGKKTLAELNDVDLSTPPSDKQVLIYDDTTDMWIAGDGSRVWQGTQAQYDALTEVDPAVTYFITDGGSIDLTLSELQDTNISSPSSGQVLSYNGSKWKNGDINAANLPISSSSTTNTKTYVDNNITLDRNRLTKLESTTISASKGASMSEQFPSSPSAMTRCGAMVTIQFSLQIPAGTYASSDTLWTITPPPRNIARAIVQIGSNFSAINVLGTGEIRFNGTQNLDSATWLIGQIDYITALS